MASASECMHKPGTPNTIIQELHPMALLYILRGVRSHTPHQLVHGGIDIIDYVNYTGKKECTPALFSACLLAGKKECTPTLLLSRVLLILERKSIATPALFSACLLTGKKECTPTLLPSRLLLVLDRKSVPLHSSLPTINWQERV